MSKKYHQIVEHRLFVFCLASILLCALSACTGLPSAQSVPTPTPTVAATPTPKPTTAPTLPAVVATVIPTAIASKGLVGPNLIVNGGAEAGPGSSDDSQLVAIPGWTRQGNLNVMNYQSSNDSYMLTTAPGPSDRGKNYFYGGPETSTDNTTTSISQAIDISAAGPLIATNQIKFTLSAYLGGYSSQNDNAKLTVQFFSVTGSSLNSVSLGPVLAADRKNTSGLVLRSTNGSIPAGTTKLKITLTMTKTDGSDNDGSADDLSLVLHS